MYPWGLVHPLKASLPAVFSLVFVSCFELMLLFSNLEFLHFGLQVPSGGKIKNDCYPEKSVGPVPKPWSLQQLLGTLGYLVTYWHQFSPALPSPSCLVDLPSGWLMRFVKGCGGSECALTGMVSLRTGPPRQRGVSSWSPVPPVWFSSACYLLNLYLSHFSSCRNSLG